MMGGDVQVNGRQAAKTVMIESYYGWVICRRDIDNRDVIQSRYPSLQLPGSCIRKSFGGPNTQYQTYNLL